MAVQALASIRELAVNWPYPVRWSSLGRWENFFLGEVVFQQRFFGLAGTLFFWKMFFQKLLKFVFFF